MIVIQMTEEQYNVLNKAMDYAREHLGEKRTETETPTELYVKDNDSVAIRDLSADIINAVVHNKGTMHYAPPTVAVIVENGLVEEIYSTAPVDVEVIDLDVTDVESEKEAQSALEQVKGDERMRRLF